MSKKTSQISQISIDKLRPGMFIVGIDQSWFKTPFLSHRRVIQNRDEIATLRECGVRQVSIEVSDKSEDEAPEVPIEPPPEPTSPNIEEELPIARAIREEACTIIEGIFEGILTGRSIESKATKAIVQKSPREYYSLPAGVSDSDHAAA